MNAFIDEISDFFMGLANFCDATSTWIVLTLFFATIGLVMEYIDDSDIENGQKTEKFSWEAVDKGRLIRTAILALVISAIVVKIILFVLAVILAVCSGLPYLLGGLFIMITGIFVFGIVLLFI